MSPSAPCRLKSHEYLRGSHHGKNGGISFETFCGNFAGRFSRKETTPSFTSSELPREYIPRLSILWASIGWSSEESRHSICRINATETAEVLSRISAASA